MTDQTRKPGTFTKGDPRINRKGRPKTFDAFRELAQQISHETALSDGKPLVIDGHIVTVAEAILRKWATSKDARLQIAFIEMAYGKAPQRNEHTGEGGGALRLEIEYVNNPYPTTAVPSRTSGDPQKPEEI